MKAKSSKVKMNNGGVKGKPVAKAALPIAGAKRGYYVTDKPGGTPREVSKTAYMSAPVSLRQVLEKGDTGKPIMPMSGGKQLKKGGTYKAKKTMMKKGGTKKSC